MAILFTILAFLARIAFRTEAPFIIVARPFERAFTELDGKTNRSLLRFRRILEVNFHLQGAIIREILHIRFKDTGHAHFLPRTHIMIVEHQGRFLKRRIGIGISLGTRIGRLVILVRIFAVVDCLDANEGRILRRHRFAHLCFNTVHLDNLRMFSRRSLVQVRNRRFFPGVSDNSKVNDLHFGLGDTLVQRTHPEPAELRFRKNRQVVASRRRNNRIVLIQRNSPLAPAIPQFIEICLVRIGQVNAVTHKADIQVQRAVPVDVFGIVCSFTGVLFGTVDRNPRITFVIQVLVKVIAGNIPYRSVHLLDGTIDNRIAFRRTAIPHHARFIGTRYTI